MPGVGSTDLLPYAGILVAAIVEGEVAYVAACALVAAGRLDAVGVVLAGATGAAIGDQAYFYLFRKRLTRLMARFPALERRTAPLVGLVRRRASAMVLLIRFAPGLRVALAAACAYVDVRPLRFSILNAVTAVVWAIALLLIVGWAGPAGLGRVGLSGWKGALVTGLLVLAAFKFLTRYERTAVDHAAGGAPSPPPR
jgi:membrane protein DedA with SNARE-associated domain